MRPRTIGRRLALQYLFMADQNRFADDVESPYDFFKSQRDAVRDETAERGGGDGIFDHDDPYQDEAEAFALSLIRKAQKSRDEIDADIEDAASNWSIARMGAIERNILRVVVAELRLDVSPKAVVIDEAVELAKRFGDKESGGFVNGIADRLGEEITSRKIRG